MKNQIKAAIFDLDGTLVDSMWMWKAIDMEYLSRYGHECPKNLQRAIEGMSFTETAVYFKEQFAIPESLEEIKAAWILMAMDKYCKEVPLKTGADRLLKALKEHGIKTGIATSNGRELVDAVLNSLGIAEYFDVVTVGCEVKAGKPAPDIYLETAKRLEVKPEECVVFEDIPAGILAGKRAGMTVFAVNDEFSKDLKQEKEELADYFIEDFLQLFHKNGDELSEVFQ